MAGWSGLSGSDFGSVCMLLKIRFWGCSERLAYLHSTGHVQDCGQPERIYADWAGDERPDQAYELQSRDSTAETRYYDGSASDQSFDDASKKV